MKKGTKPPKGRARRGEDGLAGDNKENMGVNTLNPKAAAAQTSVYK